MLRSILCLLTLLTMVSCGDLPEPFIGNPGANGRVLVQPPTPRLAVPAPPNALLPDEASQALALKLADALQGQEVPAVPGPAQSGDWRLVATAEQNNGLVVPVFTVIDPRGKDQGKAEGAAVPVAAWAAASPDTIQRSAAEAAPKIAALLTNIQIALQHADPNSLYNRRAKVMVADVTGAPGDGDASLTRQMRTRLAALGPIVQTTKAGADFVVQGQVKAVPILGNQQRIEIQWIVSTAKGDERGRVVQLNEIPAGSLDHYWGDVAVVVATEASGGVKDVLLRQTGHEPVAPAANRGQATGALLEGPGSGAGGPAR